MVTSYVQIQNHISRTTYRNYKEIDWAIILSWMEINGYLNEIHLNKAIK